MKKIPPTLLFFHTLILKLHTVFSNHCSSFWVLKKSLPCMLSAANRKPRAHVLIERKWHLCPAGSTITASSDPPDARLVWSVQSRIFFSKIRVSLDKNETYRCTKEHKVIVITKWKQSLSVEHFLSCGKPGSRKGALGIANSQKLQRTQL